ncbi:MAG TPA: hypothetical protein VFT76_00255 [Actinomycetota bacterium]|nr:hypothetical protein [Actinomycetota bacterium]
MATVKLFLFGFALGALLLALIGALVDEKLLLSTTDWLLASIAGGILSSGGIPSK